MSSEVASSSCCPSIIYMMTGIRYFQLDVLTSEEFIGAEEYMLFAVTDGIAEIDTRYGTQEILRASLAIVEPDQAIHIHTYNNSISFYVITFKAIPIPDLNASEHKQQPASFPYKGIWNHVPFARCIDLLEEIYLHSQDKEEFMRFFNHVRFEEFLRYVLQQNSSMAPVRDLKSAVKSSIDYLSDNYAMQVTVAQLAADVDMFPWQYSQMFKELTGQIPLSFVNKLRIDHAKQLLLKTEDRIHEIAQHVGFNNEFYFNRRFKKSVGVAPGQYRKQQRSTLRVVSLYMEDLLITLGVIPVVQWSHPGWGRQEYLGLKHVPIFNVLQDSYESLSEYEPDLIIARRSDYELHTNQYEQCKQFLYTDVIIHDDMDLHSTLRTLAERLGRVDQAEYAIQQYEDKVSRAKKLLSGSMRNQTYVFLRIAADCISVDQKYTKPFLWRELGITPHPMVQALTHEVGRQGVTWEWLNELDADYIFFAFDKWHEHVVGSERRQIDHPMWQTIPAVRNRRAFEVDFMTWMNQGQLLANSKKIDDVLRMLAY
ncbi:hypothetical protein PMSM_08280 [Paenibacillus macquariensis subsp. macquariensis]|uniref:Transcriptional regulator of bacillibactin transport n=2 Tax=Paenibacillus macquariensis TaxID=948756 RepID=A0ABY1JT89_9BACL|nr:hypothetical protein PMSM_08280 [Paenibacillus macquariensis subsp. macquariensis]SIQ72180.1 transcriptional regulator of bacillibactin transport [Paenibacillus macquariensis]